MSVPKRYVGHREAGKLPWLQPQICGIDNHYALPFFQLIHQIQTGISPVNSRHTGRKPTAAQFINDTGADPIVTTQGIAQSDDRCTHYPGKLHKLDFQEVG